MAVMAEGTESQQDVFRNDAIHLTVNSGRIVTEQLVMLIQHDPHAAYLEAVQGGEDLSAGS